MPQHGGNGPCAPRERLPVTSAAHGDTVIEHLAASALRRADGIPAAAVAGDLASRIESFPSIVVEIASSTGLADAGSRSPMFESVLTVEIAAEGDDCKSAARAMLSAAYRALCNDADLGSVLSAPLRAEVEETEVELLESPRRCTCTATFLATWTAAGWDARLDYPPGSGPD